MKEENSNLRKQRGVQKEEVLFPLAESLAHLPENYGPFIQEIKARIRKTRLETVLAANAAMIMLYWDIGNVSLRPTPYLLADTILLCLNASVPRW